MEEIKEKLINERIFFNVYSFFTAGLTTGIVSLVLRDDFGSNKIVLILFIYGILFLIFTIIALIHSYTKINEITKKLRRL